MKRWLIQLVWLLVLGGLLSSCSMMTAQGRRERAYNHYVEKMSRGRIKQQQRLSAMSAKVPRAPISQPVVTAETSGPESVSVGDGSSGL